MNRQRRAYNRGRRQGWRGWLAVAAAAAGLSWFSITGAGDAVSADDSREPPDAFAVCAACHAYLPNDTPLIGPTLWGVLGRKVASVEGYPYSDGLKKIEGTWDRARLDQFLTDPQAFAPGVQKSMRPVHRAADRKEIIDFLETLVPRADRTTDSDN